MKEDVIIMKCCKYCGKECKNNLSLGCHEVRCKLNPNRKVWVSWKPSSIWNKGLTKESDGALIVEVKKEGEHIPIPKKNPDDPNEEGKIVVKAQVPDLENSSQ